MPGSGRCRWKVEVTGIREERPRLVDPPGFHQRGHRLDDGRPVEAIGGPARVGQGPSGLAERRARVSVPGGSDAAIRSRSHLASAGLAPPVETATVTRPSRWTAGSRMVPGASGPAPLTSTPADMASATTVASTAGTPVAVTTSS